MSSQDLRNRMRVALGSGSSRDELDATLGGLSPAGVRLYVDTIHGYGSDTQCDGRSLDRPFLTMSRAFTELSNLHAKVATSGSYAKIFVVGGIYENLTAPTNITDVSIIGCGNKPRHDNTTNALKKGASAWRTASGVTDQPLCIFGGGQGWSIQNMLIAPPSAEAGFRLVNDSTHDGSHFRMSNCRVAAGKYAIDTAGGAGFVGLYNNRFEAQTTASIVCSSTSNAIPLQWDIQDNYFGYLSASHILASASSWNIKNNVFATVASTAVYIDLTYNSGQGLNNFVSGNVLGGTYTTADYVASSTDLWLGNWVTAISTQAPNGFTILPPAA